MKRPASIDEMRAAMARFATSEGVEKGLSFKPLPTDVFISPFAKCGTTWMQQIVHGLRTGGSMEFDEITEVVPWVEMAHDAGFDLENQVADPRAFKSHCSYDEIPKGGKYITVFRDPADACLSLYRFFEGWYFEKGSIGLDEFVTDYYLRRDNANSYWHHAASWWRVRDRADVLLFAYEDLKDDLSGAVERVADFIGIPLTRELKAVVVEQSGFDFMKRHASQFDDHLIRKYSDAASGLPPGGESNKVATGTAGAAKPALSGAAHAALATKWADTLDTEFGLADYAALRAAVNRG